MVAAAVAAAIKGEERLQGNGTIQTPPSSTWLLRSIFGQGWYLVDSAIYHSRRNGKRAVPSRQLSRTPRA